MERPQQFQCFCRCLKLQHAGNQPGQAVQAVLAASVGEGAATLSLSLRWAMSGSAH